MLVWKGLYSLEVSECLPVPEAPEPLQENEGKTSHRRNHGKVSGREALFFPTFYSMVPNPSRPFPLLKNKRSKELKAEYSPRMLSGRGYSVRLVGSSTKEEITALYYGLWLPATVCSSMLIGLLILSVLSNILNSYQNTCGLPLYPTRQFTAYPALQSLLIYLISVTPH